MALRWRPALDGNAPAGLAVVLGRLGLSEDDMAQNNRAPTADDPRRNAAERALAEQRAQAEAVNKNMERLRALRLAREALEHEEKKDGSKEQES